MPSISTLVEFSGIHLLEKLKQINKHGMGFNCTINKFS